MRESAVFFKAKQKIALKRLARVKKKNKQTKTIWINNIKNKEETLQLMSKKYKRS